MHPVVAELECEAALEEPMVRRKASEQTFKRDALLETLSRDAPLLRRVAEECN